MENALRLLRRRIRLEPQNADCCILRKPLKECKKVYKKISKNGFVRGYDAESLYKYFETMLDNDEIDKLNWPICRELVASIEVKRLEKFLKIPISKRVTTRKNEYWATLFLETLQSSISEMLAELKEGILGQGSVDMTIENVTDLTSNLTASLLYVYLISKPKWRRLKNSLRDDSASVNHVFKEIKFLSEEMASLFTEHDLVLSWCGSQITPIVFRRRPPNRLL